MEHPEIDFADPPVRPDLHGRAARERLAVIEHGDAIGDREHDVHIVLDHQHRQCAGQRPDELDHLRGLGRRHAGGGFIEQQQLGLAGERNADFKLTLLAVGEAARNPRAVSCEMDLRHQFCGAPDQLLIAAYRGEEIERVAEAYLQGKPQVLDHAQVLEHVVALERARHSHATDPARRETGDIPTLHKDTAGAGLELAADLIDEARLARAIRSDDDVALTSRQDEIEIVGDDQAAERFVEMLDAQDAHCTFLGTAWVHRSFCKVPHRPPGKNITQQMKVMPMMASQCSL